MPVAWTEEALGWICRSLSPTHFNSYGYISMVASRTASAVQDLLFPAAATRVQMMTPGICLRGWLFLSAADPLRQPSWKLRPRDRPFWLLYYMALLMCTPSFKLGSPTTTVKVPGDDVLYLVPLRLFLIYFWLFHTTLISSFIYRRRFHRVAEVCLCECA